MLGPVDSTDLRRRNLSLVLTELARLGTSSRSDLTQVTGLVSGSLTNIVADLLARGLVEEASNQPTSVRGRPRRQLSILGRRVVCIAVRIYLGQTDTAIMDFLGNILWRDTTKHSARFGSQDWYIDEIIRSVSKAADAVGAFPGSHLDQIVLALTSPVYAGQRRILLSIDFGLPEMDIASLVHDRLPELTVDLAVVNAANLEAIAEFISLHPSSHSMVYFRESGSNVSGGLVVDGNIHTGFHGFAGEVGHIVIHQNGRPCECGARGCLVQYIRPEEILDDAGLTRERQDAGTEAALEILSERLASSDDRALGALSRAGEALGSAMVSIINLVDTETIVLGGYLGRWFTWLQPGLDSVLAGRRLVTPGFEPQIIPGVLGPDAALLGAALLSRERVLEDPSRIPNSSAPPTPT